MSRMQKILKCSFFVGSNISPSRQLIRSMYNLDGSDSYVRESVFWVVMPFQCLAWRMTQTFRSHLGKPWVSFSGGNIVSGASGAGAGTWETKGAIMVRTMRFMELVG
jgi:hypothetical protein